MMTIYMGLVKEGQFWGQQLDELELKSFSSESDIVSHWPKKELELSEFENQSIIIQKSNSNKSSVIQVLDQAVYDDINKLYDKFDS